MGDLVVTDDASQLVIAGERNTLDVGIEQHIVSIDRDESLAIAPVDVGLELRSDDVVLDITTQSLSLLTIGMQGPMGPAGDANGSGGEPLEHLYEPLDVDSAYRGDAVIGSAESDAVWKIVKIVIQPDGTPLVLNANDDAGFVHVWNDRARYNYV